MKILTFALLLITLIFGSSKTSQASNQTDLTKEIEDLEQNLKQCHDAKFKLESEPPKTNAKEKNDDVQEMASRCAAIEKKLNEKKHANRGTSSRISEIQGNGQSSQQQCEEFMKLSKEQGHGGDDTQKMLRTCEDLRALTKAAGNNWSSKTPDVEKSSKKSIAGPGGQLECKNPAIHTIDYKPCLNILGLYSGVIAAEQAMELQQKIRRDLKDQSINEDTARKAAEGDLQTAAYDGMIEKHKHEKSLNTEKVIAYGAAVTALIGAYNVLPSLKDAVKKCKSSRQSGLPENCDQTVNDYGAEIIANDDNKRMLAMAIAQFMAKAAAAGIALNANIKSAKAIDKVKKTFDDETADLMMDRCQFNPADPACINPGPRVRGGGGLSTEFGIGDGSANSFNFNTDEVPFGEPGAETDLGDLKTVNTPNSPFKTEAEKANGILNPAGAAQVQATGGAGGGGGSGGGGGGGAGGSSLGGDLEGPQEANKESEIKTNKVSGIYDNPGGGGYKALGKGKGDDANPFASLFDQKGSEGGVEEDRSIASEDIADKDMDLFKKISKRYGLIQADKRIEAQNLE